MEEGNSTIKDTELFTAQQIKRPSVIKKIRHAPDYILIISVLMLTALGILMVYSSSYYTNAIRARSTNSLFLRQLISAVLGSAVAFFILSLDYHVICRFSTVGVLAAGVLLLCVFVPGLGMSEHGSSRWLNVFGISVQPSEIMKFALIVFLAKDIGSDPKRLEKLRGGYLRYVIIVGTICIPIFFMPNFSAIVCILFLTASVLFTAGAKARHLIITGLIGLGALTVLLVFAPYRVGRILAMMDPFNTSISSTYQLRQSLYSISYGGFFGQGLGNSMQKMLYLPFSESDFIFAIIVEELGFAGALFVLLLYGVLIYRGIKIAYFAPDLTGSLLAAGATSIITIQVIVNICVCTGCFPTTGVILPFISYGGSALTIFMAMIGLMLSVSRYTVRPVKIKSGKTES